VARKRLRHEDDEQRDAVDGFAARRADVAPGEPAATVLDLQAKAGNAAVAALVAGEGPAVLREAIQRQPAGEDAEEQTGKKRTRAFAVLVVPDLDLSTPLRSVSLRERRPAGESKVTPTDVDLAIAAADFNPRLYEAAAKGTVLRTATISFVGYRWILTDVMVASVSMTRDIYSLTLAATGMEAA
jgi:hypothetical protein